MPAVERKTDETHRVRVHDGTQWHDLTAPDGANLYPDQREEVVTGLRQTLLKHDLSPYTRWTRHVNCGGRSLCATCGVRLGDEAPAPTHWHDRLAARFGYPRLSCQVTVDRPLTAYLLPDKRIWGTRSTGNDADHR